ncbi:hypothetical protein MANES_01G056750v8 [Manihot esculenta]|uniref:Uncharacterized protein n=1 Tax=Manihot esculenta TaxID=3983 RepID=A0ACB7IC72_MANES|nr:hypothetical protein MANES_01G056750v8 [Manihot esculenta]
MLTSLLVPYIFFSLPAAIFNLLRGEVGKWIAFIAVVLRLFFPRHFPVKQEHKTERKNGCYFIITITAGRKPITEQREERREDLGLIGSESDITELKKMGLCLVPLSMVVNYFG